MQKYVRSLIWNGNDPASGFGEFACDGDTLMGRIYIHDGDVSSFVAKKISGDDGE
jgi:hypothetical protein